MPTTAPVSPSTSSTAPAISPQERLMRSIRYRPLLWMAPALALGCALGPQWAWWNGVTRRDDVLLYWPLLPALLGLLGVWLMRRQAFGWRISLMLALFAVATVHSARRILMPSGNIASLVRGLPRKAVTGPVDAVPLLLRGWVAESPEHNDLYTEFPLQCQTLRLSDGRQLDGRVWVRAPLDTPIEVGDAVALDVELRDLPRVGSPGERARDWHYLIDNCWCLARVKQPSQIHLLRHGERYALQRMIVAWRRRLVEHYETAFAGVRADRAPAPPFPYATAQLVAAMVFGEGGLSEPLPPLTRDQFRVAGLTHLLVVSGAQISLAVLGLVGLLRLIGLRRWWIVVVVIPVLLIYVMLAGSSPSIWRAGIAAICVTWAIVLGREADGVTLWSLALAVLLLIDPANLFDLSFQLTFAATWGLLCLAPVLLGLLKRAFGASTTIEVVALTLGAQLATLPLILYQFGQLSIVGFGCNLLGVPLASLLVTTSLAGFLLPAINPLNYHLMHALTTIAAVGSRLPGAQYNVMPWPLSRTLGCYLLLAGSMLIPLFTGFDWKSWRTAAQDELRRWWQRRRTRPLGWVVLDWLVLPTATVIVLLLWQAATGHDGKLHVALLDVGQGESMVIQSPSGRIVLIDGGSTSLGERGEVGRSVIVPYLQSIGARKIDVMIVTHADVDHCNGLENVLREVPVDLVIDGAAANLPSTTAAPPMEYLALRHALEKRHVPIRIARAGQALDLDDGVSLHILSPQWPLLQSDNDNAVVSRLDYGSVGMLFTADIERAAEERLLRSDANLRCNVLKVAHHGSQTSSSAAFLAAAQPQAAIISCGRYNPFGHPSPQVLQSFRERHIPTFRTDLDGTIEITSDGKTCSLKSFL